MEVSTPESEGKLKAHDAIVFPPFLVWIPPSSQKYYNDPLSFYFDDFEC